MIDVSAPLVVAALKHEPGEVWFVRVSGVKTSSESICLPLDRRAGRGYFACFNGSLDARLPSCGCKAVVFLGSEKVNGDGVLQLRASFLF